VAAHRPAQRLRSRLNKAKIRRVVEHIDSHIADDLSIAVLRASADLSKGHLTRQFHTMGGTKRPPIMCVTSASPRHGAC
jgi:transcriptional regulator GlxA family with amidase domain